MADSNSNERSTHISRRELLAGAGAALGAGVLGASPVAASPAAQAGTAAATRPIVFTHTTVITGYADKAALIDVALAVSGDKIAAIGPTDAVLKSYPNAEVIDGRRKALLPGVMNCHAHLSATLSRGFNEDFGFPNRSGMTMGPGRFISREESTIMAVIGAIDGLRSGTTTMVEYTGNIAPNAAELAKTGQRWVFAEGANDREDGYVLSPERLATSTKPVFSPKLREAGLQRINDLFTSWHGKDNGRIRVFPAVVHAENASPELLKAIRAFAEKHDLGYTIHANQTTAEVEFMERFHGMRPIAYLNRHGFLGPRLFAGHCRYVDQNEVELLGAARCTMTHQAAMAANRGVSPPIPAMRKAGVTIAMGTDNNNNDMFAAMKIAMLTERIRRTDEHPGMLPQPEDIYEDASLGGARATQQTSTNGSLEVGKKADIIVLNTFKSYLVPSGRILSAWMHNGRASDVESMLVDGKFIMRDSKILTIDEEALVTEAEKIGQRAWKQALEANAVTLPSYPGRPREPITKVPTFAVTD